MIHHRDTEDTEKKWWDGDRIREELKRIVPEYRPDGR